MNTRIFVSKKEGFQTEERALENSLKSALGLNDNFRLTLYCIYDVFNASLEDIELLKSHILAEKAVDTVWESPDVKGKVLLAYEYLPGQYDQRADSAMQCLMLLNNKNDVHIRSGRLLAMENVSDKQLQAIESYMINPVEACRKDLDILDDSQDVQIAPVIRLEGFGSLDEKGLEALRQSMGLAMSLEDLAFVQEYFKNTEKRDPYETEIRVLDTYWSDHCRHTTFETQLEALDFSKDLFADNIAKALDLYRNLRRETGRECRPETLMDMATIAARALRKRGLLADEEISDEINACSILVDVDVNGNKEPWLLMFKNETHNHPTEIEPFGGASTCIGGAIRDPLSGRAYVYQAMRITGAGDITAPLKDTLPHKLPQSKISKLAAQGYSSYGNQIGLATTYVRELFDPGYTAKRMEVGAVVAAAPKDHVKRLDARKGDLILLLGGATGRDGIGGATGSSKEHNDSSLEKCSSEVQKGNAVTERKIQRLFRDGNVTRMIRKCNDFGAGGVCVAIGELAEGLDIDLDAVPVKYEGLNGTELAISESQERMAVVIDPKDLDAFLEACAKENLNAVVAAVVSDSGRLKMSWKGQTLVDMSREFLDTNGVRQKASAIAEEKGLQASPFEEKNEPLTEVLRQPNVACQMGMGQMFDGSIGKSTVLMPYGGKYQLTPEEGSVQKLPVSGFTNTCSVMAYGFNPELANYSPYLSAQYSVIMALARLAALGADPFKARLSNQEYFQRLQKDPAKWAAPAQALLGLVEAQMEFGTPSIGGKDSMSGTFNDLHVPDTLITFAVVCADTQDIAGSALKKGKYPLYLLEHTPKENGLPDYGQLKANFAALKNLHEKGHVLAARSVDQGGLSAALALMAFGNKTGLQADFDNTSGLMPGSLVIQCDRKIDVPEARQIGWSNETDTITINGRTTSIKQALAAWIEPYKELYPCSVPAQSQDAGKVCLKPGTKRYSKTKVEVPQVVIPVFPGQNCEYDCAAQFERAGAKVDMLVFNNQSVKQMNESIDQLAQAIENANILMIAGGFSLGDEPDGSGKYIANVLRNPKIAEAVKNFQSREGLILGICNGFQALVKSGLLPYGSIRDPKEDDPTLFHNDISRHISKMASTRVVTTNSPWLQDFECGDIHTVAFSHGEGKFVARPELLEQLAQNGQIAFQYVNEAGQPAMDEQSNPNGSLYAIEGLISPDGMVLGKMGHSERYEEGLFQNIEGNKNQNLFQNGVRFFTHEGEEA